jgi:catechol 2,3-dioxygenase-like lactoylglutathione lyase family enzyme
VGSAVTIIELDHIVLNVADVERSLRFYCDELGLPAERVDEWRRQEVFFPSVRVNAGTLIDLVQLPRTGENADHFCLVVAPTDFDALKASGRLDVVSGPATRFGARGDGTSLYIRDPDRNLVELRYYGDVVAAGSVHVGDAGTVPGTETQPEAEDRR